MIVVIDTNVWISALQFARPNAPPTRALAKAMREDVIAICEEIETEILRILTEKFDWQSGRAARAIEAIIFNGLRVGISGVVKVCRDANDNVFLECAEVAKADFLISGDKDLLILRSYKHTRIVSPAEYLEIEN